MLFCIRTCGSKHGLLSHSALPFDRIGVRMQIGPINDSLVACRHIPDIVYGMILIDALKLIGGSNDGDIVMYVEGVLSGRARHKKHVVPA